LSHIGVEMATKHILSLVEKADKLLRKLSAKIYKPYQC
jgi:hypothetical protein